MINKFVWADGVVLIGPVTKDNHHGGMIDRAIEAEMIPAFPQNYALGYFSEDETHGGQFPNLNISNQDGDVPTNAEIIADIRDELRKSKQSSFKISEVIEIGGPEYIQTSHEDGDQPWIYVPEDDAFYILTEREGHHNDLLDRLLGDQVYSYEELMNIWQGEWLPGDNYPDEHPAGQERVMIYKDLDQINAAEWQMLPKVMDYIRQVWPDTPIIAYQSASYHKLARQIAPGVIEYIA